MDRPIPKYLNRYYFEVQIINFGETQGTTDPAIYLYIGLSYRDKSKQFPYGDTDYGYEYSCAQGQKYVDEVYASYSEGSNVNDIIGCLYDLEKNEISFTKNGKLLGTAYTNIDRNVDYYPFVNMEYKQNIDVFVKLGVNDEFVNGPNVGEDPKEFIYQPNFKYGNYE